MNTHEHDLVRARLNQARESLDEAKALLAEGMDTGFVLTSLYYAFYYPVVAVLNEGRVPETMQSVALGLFDQQFIKTGIFKKEYYDALRRVFDIKPKCSGEKTPVSAEDVDELAALANAFIQAVETYWEKRPAV